MKRTGELLAAILPAIVLLASISGAAAGQAGVPAEQILKSQPGVEPYWQQDVAYDIKVTLDVEKHELIGTETITYKNNSPDTLEVFYLHLYPNAFQYRTSPLIRDFMQGTLYFLVGLPKSMRGWIDVTELTVDGTNIPILVEGTILSGRFPNPLPPGATATIGIAFDEKIMKRLGRAGYSGEQYDMAQWYPKLVVYDKNGWHPDQYRMGEFYGEFGTFDVRITLPERYVIAATGVPVDGDPGWKKNPLRRGGPPGMPPGAMKHGGGGAGKTGVAPDSTKTVTFHAEKVHDFAWCANPLFVVQDTTYHDIHVMSVFPVYQRSWVDTNLVQMLRAVQWLEKTVGPYGYPQVTVVSSPTRGGMEYPMLAMDGAVGQELVIHEVAHNWFYGMLGNDERAEAWLDEGFAQYMTFWYAEAHYGPYGKLGERMFPWSLFPRYTMWEGLAKPVVKAERTGYAERISTPVQEFKNGYDVGPYIKAPLFLRALRYTLGDSTFEKSLRTYFDQWKFRHVDEEAFRSVCEEVSGVQLDDMFKEWLHTTKECDYRVTRFKPQSAKEGWDAALGVERKGELIMPLSLTFRLKNGNTVSQRIAGDPRSIAATVPLETKPASAAIDPGNEILDIYERDNYSPRRTRFSLDVPFNTYYPLDAYSIRALPIGYYNDIDGGKVGLRLRGSYDNFYRKVTLQGLYGVESRKTDFYASYEGRVGYLGRDATYIVKGFNREGRRAGSIELDKIQRSSLYDPLARYMRLWLIFHQTRDLAYVRPFTYERGIDFKIGASLRLAPKTDIFATDASLDLERSFWGSDFNFEKASFKVKVWPATRFTLPLKPSARFFFGRVSVFPPTQELFNLSGANTLVKEDYFWLRSVGAFPAGKVDHFHVAGDANLRGYYHRAFAFKRLYATNLELDFPFPLPVSRGVSRVLERRLYAFFDAGKIIDKKPLEGLPPGLRSSADMRAFHKAVTDFGLGVSVWRLNAEFPFYLNHPKLVGEKEQWDWRWTVGFTRSF